MKQLYYTFFSHTKLCIGWTINAETSCIFFFYKNTTRRSHLKVLRKKIYYSAFYIIFLILELIKYASRVVNSC